MFFVFSFWRLRASIDSGGFSTLIDCFCADPSGSCPILFWRYSILFWRYSILIRQLSNSPFWQISCLSKGGKRGSLCRQVNINLFACFSNNTAIGNCKSTKVPKIDFCFTCSSKKEFPTAQERQTSKLST